MKAATSNIASYSRHAATLPNTSSSLRLETEIAPAASRATPPVRLTTRQREVLALLCEGLPNKLICRCLNIATGTVKVHISCILRELGVASRLQAVVAASRLGIHGDLAGGAR